MMITIFNFLFRSNNNDLISLITFFFRFKSNNSPYEFSFVLINSVIIDIIASLSSGGSTPSPINCFSIAIVSSPQYKQPPFIFTI